MDLNPPPYQTKATIPLAIYVALSRVTSLEGLHIARDFDEKWLRQEWPDCLREELAKLNKLHERTKEKYPIHHKLARFVCSVS